MNSFVKNNRKFYSIILIFSMLFYSLFGSIGATFASANNNESNDNVIELKVLHTNDLHAKINDFGKIAAYINEQRNNATHSLYLDAGDIFSGNPVVDLNKGKPIIELLNLMGLQAMAIGNHDFDYGQAETVQRIAESDFHWLSANTVVTNDTTVEFPQPKPYQVFDVEGVSVAVLGLTETPPSTAPANVIGINFLNPIEKAKEFAYLKEQHDVVIALTHHGYTEDIKLAEAVDYFDVIIGGHSHTVLASPRVVNGTPIVQTGGNAENIGNLSINLNPNTKEVISVNGSLQKVSELTVVDEIIQEKVDAYNAEMDELLGVVIGETETGLNRSGNGDSSLGNFWTDAILFHTDADIALTNNGGLRANINAGEITKNDIYIIEPFANEIMKIEMTGAAIKEVIRYSYTRDNRNRVDLQTAGLTYKIITNNVGQYITAELFVNGEQIKDDEKYVVAVGDYIGTGGSGYNFEGTVLEAKSGFMTEAMINFAQELTTEGQKINYTNNQRISIEVSTSAPPIGNVIGTTEKGLSSANNTKGDSSLGNLYTDSVREVTGADIGVLNNSSVSGNIAAGNITDGQIEFLDQFKNEVVVTKTTVKRLKEVLLEQATFHNGVDVQVSGIHYELVKENGKFVEVKVTDVEGNVIADATELTVAYNDFMHGRGFYNLGSELVGENHGKVWEAVVSYVTEHEGPIDYVEGSRISISGQDTPTPGDPGDLPPGVISVAEAIENNSGEATVHGFIVGHIVSTTNVKFTAPFSNDFNMAIADTPNETDLSKMLFVQIPAAFRTEFGLQTNPTLVGSKVEVKGNLQVYFNVPGMQGMKDIKLVEMEEEQPVELISIADARSQASNTEVKVEGVVTTKSGGWGQKGFYIQDETAGIFVFQNNYDVNPGDKVTFTGVVGAHAQELQISNIKDFQVVGQVDLPEALEVTPAQITSANESQLVVIEGVEISNLNSVNNFGTFEFTATKDGESVLVRVDNRTGLVYDDFAFQNGDIVNITGVSSRFNETIQLKPRGANDIVEFVPSYEEPEVKSEATTSFVDTKGNEVKKLARNLDVKLQTQISNHLREAKNFNVMVTLVDKHGRVKHNVEEEIEVSGESEFTYTHKLKVPTNHVGQKYKLTVTVMDEESNVISQETVK
ncbi:MAG: 5'-nucleotidase C-terminal domain-containing protein [Bacillaceae bacterium]|nr:5'-nucleotidase C-terminal domain-containing protein [Bacillaceae bacterium]